MLSFVKISIITYTVKYSYVNISLKIFLYGMYNIKIKQIINYQNTRCQLNHALKQKRHVEKKINHNTQKN